MPNHKKRSAQLGMPFATANSRLRKSILFMLLQKYEENKCYVCKQVIVSKDDLSIEHKLPWEDVDPKLFWDLDNIAFSHIRCNVPHRHNIVPPPPFHTKTKDAPEGMSWCTGHKDYLLNEAFHFNQRNVNGVASYCKECRKIRLD